MVVPRFRGDRLAAAREAAGLSRSQLAATVGLAASDRVRVWETGVDQPVPRLIPQLAAAVHVSVWDLLDAEPEQPSLAALRLAAGLSLEEMCAASGLSFSKYRRLERGIGIQVPDETAIAQVSQTLGVPAEQVRNAAYRARDARGSARAGSDEEAESQGGGVGDGRVPVPSPRQNDQHLGDRHHA